MTYLPVLQGARRLKLPDASSRPMPQSVCCAPRQPPFHPAFEIPVKPEFTNWRSEQTSWRESLVLADRSHHMSNLPGLHNACSTVVNLTWEFAWNPRA
jgi:hypothetical protein